MKTNYEVTIGYTAVLTVAIKANSEKEAKEKAEEIVKRRRDKIAGEGLTLQDDNFRADGIIDMDRTWLKL